MKSSGLKAGKLKAKSGQASDYFADAIVRAKTLRCFFVNFENILEFQTIQERIKQGGPSKIRASGEKMLSVMRSELDNCAELLKLMKESKSKLIQTAQKKEDENTFLFGPDLEEQLQKKMNLMISNWHDIATLFWDREEYCINI